MSRKIIPVNVGIAVMLVIAGVQLYSLVVEWGSYAPEDNMNSTMLDTSIPTPAPNEPTEENKPSRPEQDHVVVMAPRTSGVKGHAQKDIGTTRGKHALQGRVQLKQPNSASYASWKDGMVKGSLISKPFLPNKAAEETKPSQSVRTSESETSESEAALKDLIDSPTSEYHLFQVAKPGTGSTALHNILVGLFEGAESDYAFMLDGPKHEVRHHLKFAPINTTIVTKTHDQNIDAIERDFSNQFSQTFFLVSNRGRDKVDDKYCTDQAYAKKVICFEYEDFVYKTDEEMKSAITRVKERMQEQFPYFQNIKFDELRTFKRLKAMGEVLEALKGYDFQITDQKYGVHGHHKGRHGKPETGK